MNKIIIEKYLDTSALKDKGFLIVTLPDAFLSYASLNKPNKDGQFKSQFVFKADNTVALDIMKEALRLMGENIEAGTGDDFVNDFLKGKNKSKHNLSKSYKMFNNVYDEDDRAEQIEKSKSLYEEGCFFFDASTANLKDGEVTEFDNQTTKKPAIYITDFNSETRKQTQVLASSSNIIDYGVSGLSVRCIQIIMYKTITPAGTKFIGRRLNSILLSRFPKGSVLGGGTSQTTDYSNYLETDYTPANIEGDSLDTEEVELD
jgi:hypothetical protein